MGLHYLLPTSTKFVTKIFTHGLGRIFPRHTQTLSLTLKTLKPKRVTNICVRMCMCFPEPSVADATHASVISISIAWERLLQYNVHHTLPGNGSCYHNAFLFDFMFVCVCTHACMWTWRHAHRSTYVEDKRLPWVFALASMLFERGSFPHPSFRSWLRSPRQKWIRKKIRMDLACSAQAFAHMSVQKWRREEMGESMCSCG